MKHHRPGGPALLLLLGSFIGPEPAVADPPPGAVPFELQMVPVADIPPRTVTAWERDHILYLSVNQISVLLEATKRWRSDLGRMTLILGDHEVTVWEGSEIAAVDESRLIHLPAPAFFWEGEILVPLNLILNDEGTARSWLETPIFFSREDRILEAGKRRGVISNAGIERESAGWRLYLEADVPLRVDPVAARKSSFVVRITGVVYDPNLYPLPTRHPWFQGLRLRQIQDELEVSFTPGPRTLGYEMEQPSPSRLEIFLGWDERDMREGRLRSFSRVSRNTLPLLRVVALDPGHGGKDKGSTVQGESEADLTWELGRILAGRLRSELGVETVFTRRQSDSPNGKERAARANEASADLFLSLHIHPRSGGAAGFVARTGETASPGGPGLGGLGFRRFGGGQAPHLSASLVAARLVLDAVAGRLELSSLGIHSQPVAELAAAAMPALILELGGDRRWTRDRLNQVADGVVEGLRLYRLAEEGEP